LEHAANCRALIEIDEERLDAAAWSQNSGRWGRNKLRESPILLEVYLHGNSIFRGCPQHGHKALWLPLFRSGNPARPDASVSKQRHDVSAATTS
jgi:hypothetical protein